MKHDQLKTPMATPATMNVYCCGGAGINQGAALEKQPWYDRPGFAAIETIFLDTSISNFRGVKAPHEQIYIFEGVDGSGGAQWTNSDKIAEAMPEVMLCHPPSTHNLVVASIGGGSGAVIALSLIRQLMLENALVTAIFIGDTSTGTFAHNTVQSLKNLTGMVSKFDKRTLPATVLLNRPGTPTSRVDAAVREYISYYAALFSDTLNRLDYSDVFNWANQERLSVGVKAPLTIVSAVITDASGKVIDETDGAVSFDSIASVLSMHANRDDYLVGGGEYALPYNAVGYMVEDYSMLGLKGNLNLIAYTDAKSLYDKVNAQKTAVQKVFKARPANNTIPVDDTESGFSFS